jgi:hypothetical protein
MIRQKILILNEDAHINRTEFNFPKGTEFEIVADIVYMGGFPIPLETQKIVYDWLVANMANKQLFTEDLRRFI